MTVFYILIPKCKIENIQNYAQLRQHGGQSFDGHVIVSFLE